MGDVNGLKIVNDTLGHLEGDNLLRSIAGVLKRYVILMDMYLDGAEMNS